MNNFNPKFYEILGRIPRFSTQDDIKKAYRVLAKLYHPDLSDCKEHADEKMKELNEAYSILSNPEKRAEYDKALDNFMRQKEQEEQQRRQKEQEDIRRKKQYSESRKSTSGKVDVVGLAGVALAIIALGLILDAILGKKK